VRVLLDECVDWRLIRDLAGHDVATVRAMGWMGVKNGNLLALASSQSFEVLITVDGNLSFQQNLASSEVAVVVLQARTNRLADLRPLVPELLAILPDCCRGEARIVSDRA
jgi:hypothetical protein